MKDRIFDKSIAFGLTPFETIYFYNNKAQYVREHYNRLRRACRVLGVRLDAGVNLEAFITLIDCSVQELTQIHGSSSGVLKVVPDSGSLMIKSRPPAYDRDMYEVGMKLGISRVIRDKHSVFSYFKTFNYGNGYIEDHRAKRRGFDSSLHLNQYGNICETAFANIFFVKGKTLYSPTITNGILNGIVRYRVLKIALGLGYSVVKGNIDIKDIVDYNECFVTNSVAGIFPVSRIEDYKFQRRDFVLAANQLEEFARPWNMEAYSNV